MSQEMRLKGNRQHVADLLDKAARALQKALQDVQTALQDVQTAQDMLQAVEEAEKHVQTAHKLARFKPTPGVRPLPRRIQGATTRAVKALEKLAAEVRATPVTKDEIVTQARRQARQKAGAK